MIGNELEVAIGDAPEHIAGLRKLAVAFAIGGRLDGPSTTAPEELLTQIETTRKELERAGQVKKRKVRLTVQPEHLPEVFNDLSRFVPLAEIASIEKGKTGIKQAVAGEFPLVVTAAARETCDHFDFDAAAAIIPLVSSTGHGNASINRLHYQEGKFALGTILAAVIPHDPRAISARFLFEYLSAFKDELLVSRMTGTANVTLTIGRIGEVPVPLLSAEAQTKVDELMALCDRLEEARKTREEVRDKLTAASLPRLTAPETTSEDFPTHAAFALDALPALTTRPDQIKTLRQTILNLAVRGKLVEQDPADEPASNLLEQIAEDRDRLSKEGEIKKQKPILPLDDSEVPYEAPENWQWARFNEIAAIQSNLVSPKGYPDMPHIAPDNIEGWTARLLPYVSVKEAGVFSGKHSFSAGSILYSKIRPNLAKVTIVDFDGLCSADMYPIRAHIHREFLVKFMITQAFVDQSVSEDNRVAMPKINQAALSNIMIPVPPLAEQHRLVAKVDALMALCDRLEAALTTTDTTRTRLLEALLHEALEPAANALEAAE